MTKFKQEPLYKTADAEEVSIDLQRYYVFVKEQIVVRDVIGKGGKNVLRRVTSPRIELCAILRAEDQIRLRGEA